MEKLQSYLKTLRVILIFLTAFELIYFGIALSAGDLRRSIDEQFYIGWILLVAHLIMLFILLWLNWYKFPINDKMKTNNSFLLIFLGVLGMWLWMPSSDDIDNLSNFK